MLAIDLIQDFHHGLLARQVPNDFSKKPADCRAGELKSTNECGNKDVTVTTLVTRGSAVH